MLRGREWYKGATGANRK